MANYAGVTLAASASPAYVGGVTSASVTVSAINVGDRRLEASSYLTDGYGIAQSLRATAVCLPLAQLARTWQPNRLKGIQVDEGFGTPFVAATQVFDVKPIPRKWLALARTHGAKERFVTDGTILLTCSGSVGRATLAFQAHKEKLISHDLLRVEPFEEDARGWLYAYLRAPKVRSMMRSAHYGHMIKHLEVSHIDALPVPAVERTQLTKYAGEFDAILSFRNQAHAVISQAEKMYGDLVATKPTLTTGVGFRMASRFLQSGRKRLDATYYTPEVRKLREILACAGVRSGTL